jgi:hypothetical protein
MVFKTKSANGWGHTATVLAGTAAGALLSGHPYVAGAVITTAWAAGTWRGIRHLQSAQRRKDPINNSFANS